MADIDYSTDVPKHFVRTNGWLPACQQQSRIIRKRSKKIPLRYFTFCAAEAIDVFMLERVGIIRRSDETGRLESVYFCEKEAESFGIIADLIGSPEQGFQGEFEKIVLFEEDDDTRNRDLEDDNPYTEEVRKKLKYKDANIRLRRAFPFDIINLDVFGVMFPPRSGVIAPLLKSIMQILDWQTNSTYSLNNLPCNAFTLFLTTHIDSEITNRDAIQQIKNRLEENIQIYPDFSSEFHRRFNHLDVERLIIENFPEFFSIGFPKFLIYKALFQQGWRMIYGPIYLYNRQDRWVHGRNYQIMHSVARCERIPNFGQRLDESGIEEYTQEVTKVIREGVTWVENSLEEQEIVEALANDLHEIVNFRNRLR